MKIIVSMDPGTKNFALSKLAAKLDGDQVRFKLLGSTMLDPKMIMGDMKDLQNGVRKFYDYVTPVMEDATDIVIERFQARGGKGPVIECISSMIGALAFGQNAPLTAYTASTWKNAYNRVGDLKETYEDHKELRKDKTTSHIQIHQLDATLMGMYHAYKLFGVKMFGNIEGIANERKVLRRIDAQANLML